jgi:hypothetical protein
VCWRRNEAGIRRVADAAGAPLSQDRLLVANNEVTMKKQRATRLPEATLRYLRAIGTGCLAAALLHSAPAHAFGDEGHEVVALIAGHFLTPEVRHRVFAILAADDSGLTPARDIASEATWADRYRDSDRNTTRVRFEQTREWHFVDIQIKSPDSAAACFGHPPLPPGTPASAGPAKACVIDKIRQFEQELAAPSTSAAERLMALQFVLHLVGDLHQPLHASDDADQGGNAKRVRAPGRSSGKLHHYWDTEFVRALGHDAPGLAQQLIAGIQPADVKAWSSGSAADWAKESFEIGRQFVYAKLPAPKLGMYSLSAAYVKGAKQITASQLRKAGVRLAAILNRSLGVAAPLSAP